MHFACYNGNSVLVKLLVKAYKFYNSFNLDTNFYSFYSLSLLSSGADVLAETKNTKDTPINLVCKCENVETEKMLQILQLVHKKSDIVTSIYSILFRVGI